VAIPSQVDPDTYPYSVFHLWLTNYLDWFALGMALAVAVAWRDAGRALPASLVNLAERGWLCWVLAAGCYGAFMVTRGTGVDDLTSLVRETPSQVLGRFAFNGLAAFFFVLPGVLGDGLHPINRALSRAVPVYLGLVAYGIFLWQRVWLDSVKVGHEIGSTRLSFPVMLAIVAVFSVASASVSYLVMERPLQEVGATRPPPGDDPVADGTALPLDLDQHWPASR
jgi:peptidoglycan/LPS O-acetylase OafA/YrhL